ncbi:MAG: CHAT domain-containing protein [bacterium]|nr:CHAT domain-containing protein [bacterium]
MNHGRILVVLLLLILNPCVSGSAREAVAYSDDQERSLADIDSLRIAYRGVDALVLIDAQLPDARASADSVFLKALLYRKGEVQASIGLAKESEPVLIEVIALAEAMRDSLALCEGLRWLGISLDAMGRGAEARACYERLLLTAAASGNSLHQGWAEVGMAWQDYRGGEIAECARRYRQSISHFEVCNSLRGLTWGYNGLGNALHSLGEYGETLKCFERAAGYAEQDVNPMAQAMAFNNLGGLAYSLGDYGRAMTNFESAHRIQLEINYARGAFTPALNIGLCLMKLGRFSESRTRYETLLGQARQANYRDFEGTVLDKLAELTLAQGRIHHAGNLYREILALGGNLPLKNRAESWMGLARVESRLGDHAAALASLEEGRREITGQGLFNQELAIDALIGKTLQLLGRDREALDRLRHVQHVAEQLNISDYRIEALARIASSQRALGHADSSLVVLHEAAAIWELERGLPLDPVWREQRGQLGRLLYTDLALQLLSPERPVEERQRRREAFDQLQSFKARTLLERMLGPGTVAAASVGALEPLTLDHLQWRILREGELLLDFYLGTESTLLFAVTREECRVLTLPGEPIIEERLQRYYRLLSSPPARAEMADELNIIDSAGRGVRRQLFTDVEDMLAAADVVFFTPDGVLNLLTPTALLPPSGGGESDWVRIPSATVLARIRDNRKVVAATEASHILALAGEGNGSGVALPGAAREAGMLDRRFAGVDCHLPGDGRYGGDDGLDARDLMSYDLLHLAAHADVDDEHPWNSSLNFGGGDSSERLYASDIAGAHFDARLAVLAACESARGQTLSGEGVLGLSSAFISAGVPAVVAALWPVDDTATATLMESFYTHLAAGRTAAKALHLAREQLRRDPVTAHPFFWAGFVLIGDGLVEISLAARPDDGRIILYLLVGLAALTVFMVARRRLT